MSTITKWIAALGQNVQFVAGVAHFGVAALVAEHVYTRDPLYTLIAITVAAAVKEFYFDATYETDPVQTWQDNLEDFLGWVSGGFFGFGFVVGWW